MSYTRRDEFYTDKNGTVQLTGHRGFGDDEKPKSQLPVKLQPSWEENNLPDDELNFKDLNMDDASLQLNTPPDKYSLVFITFLIHGIGVLMTWNMFITAADYFTNHKLSEEYTKNNTTLLWYKENFVQCITFAAQLPNVFFNWMNIFIHFGGNLTTRIVWSITIEVIMFILTVILAMVDSSAWPVAFFWLTMISLVIINMANGVYQNTIFGMAAKLPGKYTGAVVLGSNISGTFTSVVSILSKKFSTNIRMAAIYYFITALFVLLICFDTYFALPLNRFYRHHELKEKKQNKRENKSGSAVVPYWYVLKKAAPQLYNVFVVFFVTLAAFPAIQLNVKQSDDDFFVSEKYYTDITCFLTFNVCAMLGSWLSSFVCWPSPKYLWIFTSLRFLYIPFFLLCNYHPNSTYRLLPVLITNDYVYWIGGITMGLTSGYFSSLAMMYTPKIVEERFAPTAGMFAGAFLVTGIFSGILLSFLWPWLIQHIG